MTDTATEKFEYKVISITDFARNLRTYSTMVKLGNAIYLTSRGKIFAVIKPVETK